ncbi:polysaccharide pyruvyl transferase family protein [Patulibacter minatonensis]|uniref:polysaccharide pyruvyl transferase family protein n=1 Tax=Patulibacter minatonensis TaxID=298163 RepID=UPI0004792E2A|nr:polysaccharide pyruvyl transferase family protein [Patulibacter minatonensis]
MTTVEIVHWNPRRRVSRFLPRRIARPVNNFGDLVGPWVVGELLRRRGIAVDSARRPARLVAVGSILHLAADGDVVWGAGINGKVLSLAPGVARLDVRAVRGPRTREFLAGLGHDVPDVYGDPGALVGALWTAPVARDGRDLTVVPNLNDVDRFPAHPAMVHPRTDLMSIVAAIAASRLVVGSSLHAIVIAESFGVPARLVRSVAEPAFKYDDYYGGTGRPTYRPATTVEEAVELGGEPPAVLDPRLLEAFPADLWTAPGHGGA